MTAPSTPGSVAPTRAGFERDAYLQALETQVLQSGSDGGRPYAVLADTLLYPEGGGQPADRGLLEARDVAVEVVDVQRVMGSASHSGPPEREVRHFLSQPVAVGPTTVRLDWARRYDLMQQHTAQHLLSAIAADRFGWPTTSFHLGPEVCDVELDVPALGGEQLATLEEAVMVEVRATRAVSARRVPLAEYEALGDRVRSRGLPEGFADDVRLVEIEGIDLNTCGGTHLRSTAEIESLKLLGTERLRGGTRLYWVAGGRVRQRLGRREDQAAELRATLGASDDDLVEVARQKLSRLEQADRTQRALTKELASATAAALLGGSEPVVARHFEDREATFLQEVGRAFADGEGARLALLTARAGDRLAFVVAAASGAAGDVRELGQQVAALLDGRGGGAGQVFQGRAGSLARVEEAHALMDRVLTANHPS
ncbi:MAG TPA: alanyl-tRNA editing protein [Thermoanaerobaculia bacterium]|nr:alanyl-tRNA editing protein [Thermoanaerobaculia bacterium]